jgi:hypothetical protein
LPAGSSNNQIRSRLRAIYPYSLERNSSNLSSCDRPQRFLCRWKEWKQVVYARTHGTQHEYPEVEPLKMLLILKVLDPP